MNKKWEKAEGYISEETFKFIENNLQCNMIFLMTKLQTSKELCILGKKQWANYFTNIDGWMGNILIDEDGNAMNYTSQSNLSWALYCQSIFSVQQTRSYYLSLVSREDIWDMNHQLSRVFTDVIKSQNEKTETWEELVQTVKEKVIQWIETERPDPYVL